MTLAEAISIVGACLALVSSIVTPAIIVGRYLGKVTTTLEQFKTDHERHFESAIRQGQRLEILTEKLAETRGELRGRGDMSGPVRG